MIVLVGESGSGKSTTEKELVKRGLKKITSYTSRQPRDGEEDGVDYHFRSREMMEQLKAEGFFAECVEYQGNMYGTAKEDCKNDTVLVVEPQGLRQLHGRMDLEILSFYLCVPEAERERRMLIEGRPIEHIKSRIKNDRDIFDDISYEVDYILYDNTLEEAVTNILREVDLD